MTEARRRSHVREDLFARGVLIDRNMVQRHAAPQPPSLQMDEEGHRSAERSMCAPFGYDARAYAAGYPAAMQWLASKSRAARIASDPWLSLETKLPKRAELQDGELCWCHGDAPLARFSATGQPVWLHEDLAAYWRTQTEAQSNGEEPFPCVRCGSTLTKVRLWPGLGCVKCIAEYDALVGRTR